MSVQDELRRIRSGPAADEISPGMGVAIRGICRGDADEVSQRIREALHAVIEAIGQEPTEGEWLSRLPGWLKSKFVPPVSQAEAEHWLARWRSMSPQEKAAEEHGDGWALEDWVYWFQPDQREWEFWDCSAVGGGIVRLSISTQSLPVAHSALDWLVRAAGAESVLEEDVQ